MYILELPRTSVKLRTQNEREPELSDRCEPEPKTNANANFCFMCSSGYKLSETWTFAIRSYQPACIIYTYMTKTLGKNTYIFLYKYSKYYVVSTKPPSQVQEHQLIMLTNCILQSESRWYIHQHSYKMQHSYKIRKCSF